MDLFIVRHAWAGRPDDPAFADDALRPLTEEGRDRFARMAEKLASRGMAPKLIVTSPLLRCVQTAEILVAAQDGKAELVEREELLPGGDPEQLLAWTGRHASGLKQAAWVGHAPDVGYLVAALIGLENGWFDLKKGAVAGVAFPGLPEFGRGELRWLVTAKILGV